MHIVLYAYIVTKNWHSNLTSGSAHITLIALHANMVTRQKKHMLRNMSSGTLLFYINGIREK